MFKPIATYKWRCELHDNKRKLSKEWVSSYIANRQINAHIRRYHKERVIPIPIAMFRKVKGEKTERLVMKNPTPRPYKMKKGHFGSRMCSSCGHLFPRNELQKTHRGLVCVFCKVVKISEDLKAPTISMDDGEMHG
jgi:hypothetical protein